MCRADRLTPILVALLLAACGGDGEAPGGNGASPTPVASPLPSPPPSSALASSVPAALTVTANEPFYTVEIDGDFLTLAGVDTPVRRLRATDRRVAADAREWAVDRGGVLLRVRVVRQPCEDDMSGASRDFTATLSVDGRTVRGCGYVGTPAPPPDEASATTTTIPARFVGRWNRDAAACARPAASIEGVRVTPDELWFHESVGTVKRVERLDGDRIRITAEYEGEGERWTATQTLRVEGDRLTVTTDGQPFSRMRCPG